MASSDEEAIVRCETTKGPIVMKFFREWSPNGYDRAIELYERGFFDNSHFFRALPNFLVQFGISYSEDKELQKFAHHQIPDDPKHDPPIPFAPGIMSFAGSGPNSRTSQMFISYGSAPSLGRELWETPFGKVIEGMENAEKFYSYGDMPPWGKGPAQGKIHGHPEYIENEFPLIDSIIHCKAERLPNGGSSESDIGSKVLRKEDGISDEEMFQEQRKKVQEAEAAAAAAAEETHPEIHRELNNLQVGKPGDPNTLLFVVVAVVALGAVALIVSLVRSGRKVTAKTS